MTKIVALVSGKGGTGKTTTAINLGLALHNSGKEVLLVDGNLKTPHIGLYLGIGNVPYTIHSVLKDPLNFLNSVYVHQSGLPVIVGDISYPETKQTGYYNLPSVFEKFKGMTEIVLLDMGAGLDPMMMNFVTDALIVTNSDMVSVADALKTIKLAEENGKAVLGVVLNKKRNDAHEVEKKNIEALLGKPVIAEIPESEEVRACVPLRYPAVHVFPKSDASKGYYSLAKNIIELYDSEKRALR